MGFFTPLSKLMEKSGLFEQKERPEIRVPTGQELLGESAGFLRGQFPQFTQARETGLEALTAQGFAPQISIPGVDWGAFGPSTFEQGLATSAFQPLIQQAQRQALQIGSLAGIPSAAPAHFGRAIAPAIQNIGQFLAQQQQQRGLTEQQRLLQEVLSSEQARQFQLSQAIGQDPMQAILGGATLGGQQAQRIGAEQLARFAAEPGPAGSALLSLLGGAAGFAFGGPMGAGLGAAAGGTLGSAFGGGPSPVGFQDVAMMNQLGLGGGGTPQIGATVPVGGFTGQGSTFGNLIPRGGGLF